MSGAIKASLVLLTLAFAVVSVSYIVPVFANHTSNANVITPGFEKCNVLNNYTLTVTQTGGPDPIYNVRVYNKSAGYPFPDQNSFSCGPAPEGWLYKGFFIIGGESYCEYETTRDPANNYTIAENETLDFYFLINITSESVHPFRVSTIDTQSPVGFMYYSFPNITVDCTPPLTTKSFIGPQKKDGDVEWIDGVTLVNLTAIDQQPHPSGVDKTWYLNVIDLTEQACWNPAEYCRPTTVPLPYFDGDECVNSGQELCNVEGGYTPYTEDWYNCVENWVQSQCGVDPLWKLYRGPFNKTEESCHVLQFFSIDNVGNIEPMKTNCFFVDKTPPEMEKIVGDPKIPMPYDEFQTIGNGTAEWTDLEKYFGDYSARLYVLDGSSDIAAIEFDVDIALEDITELSFWQKIANTYGVNVILGIDADGDGVYESQDKPWHFSHDPADLGDDSFIEMDGMSPSSGNWEKVDTLTISQWWTPNNTGDGFCPEFGWNYLSDIQLESKCRVEPTDHVKVIRLLIGGSGSWVDKDAYVDDITLNEKTIMLEPKNWWVRDHVTPITLNCDDSWSGKAPHPSGDEEVCYKVSLDGSDYTDPYCPENLELIEQPGHEGLWCCLDSPQQIIFEEDSLHDLEWFCRDAVDKKSPIDLEYFRVDSQPPIIEKTVIGPQVGDCPPEPGENCYIKDWTCGSACIEGTTIQVNAYDNNTLGCTVDDITCDWWYYWNTQGPYQGGSGLTPPFNITFNEDSTHELHINCTDALGNWYEDVETFLVDSTPPVTTKIYGDPHYPANINDPAPYPHYINSSTPITLTATDAKVGVDKIYWRDTVLGNDRYCWTEYSGCQNTEGSGDWNESIGNTTTIYKNEPSCHMIEYYAVDKLGNNESIPNGPHKQCVFVENTPPTITKVVGDPKVPCDPSDPSDCDYYVRDHVTEINLTCQDLGDHPVNQVNLWYRILLDGANITDWIDGIAPQVTKTIVFNEDSVHTLQYYCEDALGNTNGTRDNPHQQIYKVDSQKPIINKTIGQPQVQIGQDLYVRDHVTPITIDAYDNDTLECAVDDITCEWFIYWDSHTNLINSSQGFVAVPFTIIFNEDSTHYLDVHCKDALGNDIWDNETFKVDSTPPETTKRYVGPQYPEQGYPKWINSSTLIYLESQDPVIDGCSVGGGDIYWRNNLVADEYCWNQTKCIEEAQGTNLTWNLYTGPFHKNEDSCHLIEYYSVDLLGNGEQEIKKQCVFVDNKPPNVTKIISEPKEQWPGDNTFYPGLTERCWSTNPAKMIECWKITMGNILNITCTDQEPHPVDHNRMCFQIELDGDDVTEEYCRQYGGTPEDGWCCKEDGIENFQFWEESQHDLKVKCEDALGNEGKIDEEKFKVEGCTYELCLYKKWNLISVPFTLFNDAPEVVFKDINNSISAVWAYDNGVWYTWVPGVGGTLTEIKPGWGYWILAKDYGCIEIAGSLFSPLEVPPSRDLQSGWNLIGYYGNTMILDDHVFESVDGGKCRIPGKPVYCALNSLVDTQEGFPRWSSLWNYFNTGGDHAGWIGLDACISRRWAPDEMEPGKGYWIEMDVKDGYAPATNCIWDKDRVCVLSFD
jgi:hypothetical protein